MICVKDKFIIYLKNENELYDFFFYINIKIVNFFDLIN